MSKVKSNNQNEAISANVNQFELAIRVCEKMSEVANSISDMGRNLKKYSKVSNTVASKASRGAKV